MKKSIIIPAVMILAITLATGVDATQRMVLAEYFTATW